MVCVLEIVVPYDRARNGLGRTNVVYENSNFLFETVHLGLVETRELQCELVRQRDDEKFGIVVRDIQIGIYVELDRLVIGNLEAVVVEIDVRLDFYNPFAFGLLGIREYP